ncbi:MAG: ATP-binding protein [Dehalococcoidia bacterium]|nr:ATP-binding protein [Dehalococcoidia bacterium]
MTVRRKALIISGTMLSILLASLYGICSLSLSTGYMIGAFFAFGVGFLALFLLLIDKLLLSGFNHVSDLSDIIRDIGESRDISKRISIKGNDELSKLGAAINRMMTELQASQDLLRRSEEKNLAMLNAMPDSICQIRKDGTVEGYKPAKDDCLPFIAAEAVGKKLSELMPQKISELAIGHMKKVLQNNSMQVFTYSIHRKGEWHNYEARMVGGSKDVVLMIVRDITEQKRAEAALIKEKEEVEKKTHQLQVYVNELEAFSYSVSHDLRAPLRSIDGFSQVLLEDYNDKLDDEGKDYLQRVRSASQHMAELIDDLLNLSRVTRCEMGSTNVDLSALAKTIAEEFQQKEPERDVQFSITPGLVVRGDANLLRVALENLLGNAWKFSGKREHARIEMGYARNNGRSAYFVRDNGAGFNMDYTDKLFGVFQRLHSDKEFEGTGIGLATVQRIISRHGGTIWAEGAVGRGATFYFRL